MVTSLAFELDVYKKIKTLFSMPESGKGYCVEVLKDGSFQRIDFLNPRHREVTMCTLVVENRPCAVFCNMVRENLCGFSGVHLYMEENFITGEIYAFHERHHYPLDQETVRSELVMLVKSLSKQKAS